jgi:hypothetical protein
LLVTANVFLAHLPLYSPAETEDTHNKSLSEYPVFKVKIIWNIFSTPFTVFHEREATK